MKRSPVRKKKAAMPVVTDQPVVSSGPCAVVLVRPDVRKQLFKAAWPVVGVGVAMAASAWLPADSPTIGFAVWGCEISLGAVALFRLLSLAKN
jgi:hypothetical protein